MLPTIASALLTLVLVVLAVVLWPPQWGGCTGLTIVHGGSMTGTYAHGDLLVTTCSTPRVGDVVVFSTAETGEAQVVHRIVGGDARGFVTRGDANHWDDPFHPSADEVRGVVHVRAPRVGLLLLAFTRPWTWVALMCVVVGLFAFPGRSQDPRETESRQPAQAQR